jgi:hypothetical protein
MKNILIPTDFTLQSINMLDNYLESIHQKNINLVFFSVFALPESEQDIVGSSAKPHLQVMNEPFRKACKKLKAKYDDTIATIQYKYLYGNSRQVFNNFLEYNKIDLIFCPYQHFEFPHKKCMDPLPIIKAVKIPVIHELYRVSKSSIVFSNNKETELVNAI